MSIKNKLKQLLQSLMNVRKANKQSSNSSEQAEVKELIQQIPVNDTPFTIVGTNERGFIITCGKWKLLDWDKKRTIDECRHLINKRDYFLLFAMMGIVVEEEVKKTAQTQRK